MKKWAEFSGSFVGFALVCILSSTLFLCCCCSTMVMKYIKIVLPLLAFTQQNNSISWWNLSCWCLITLLILFPLIKTVHLEQEADLANAACFIWSLKAQESEFFVFPPLAPWNISLSSQLPQGVTHQNFAGVVQLPPEICVTLLYLVNFGVFKHDVKSSVLWPQTLWGCVRKELLLVTGELLLKPQPASNTSIGVFHSISIVPHMLSFYYKNNRLSCFCTFDVV